MFNAKTVKGVVTQQEASLIINAVKEIEPWQDGGEFWDNRILNSQDIHKSYNKDIGKLLHDINSRITTQIQDLYGIDRIYSDLIQVVRWYDGMEQPPHSDDMTAAALTGDPNDLTFFTHREFGAIIYLNDNYEGGHTFYPNQGIEIVPEVGMLAVHPGDPEHLHGVTKISGSTRYTIASFWTQNKDFDMGWEIDNDRD